MRYMCRSLAAVATMLIGVAAHAQPSSYPTRSVTMICTYAAGGGGGVVVRKYAAGLGDLTGQPFVVVNKVGAEGQIGNQALMDAKPDGYTLMITGDASLLGNPLTMKGVDYDPRTALLPVATLANIGLILVVDAKSAIKSVADLTARIKARQGDDNYAVATVSQRLVSAWYLQKIGAAAVPVGYKATSDAINDIATGAVDFVFSDATLALAQAAAGRVRMLATTTKSRLSFAPDLPTMEEAGIPGVVYSVVWSAWAPKNTPPAIVDQLHRWLNGITEKPDTKAFLNRIGAEPLILDSPAAMRALVADKFSLWKQLVAIAKLPKS
jgi:tripartite-type tricarboxylate transporter receptor subunit TctC